MNKDDEPVRHQNSATAFNPTVPVPSMDKGGGQRWWSLLSHN